jgi:beta-glucosidase
VHLPRGAEPGDRAGTAVPQLYVGLPEPSADIQQPPKQLKGFEKLSLQPGETRRVTFPIDDRALSYWDVTSNSWRIAPGCYEVMVGRSSRDIELTGTMARNSAACGNAAVPIP